MPLDLSILTERELRIRKIWKRSWLSTILALPVLVFFIFFMFPDNEPDKAYRCGRLTAEIGLKYCLPSYIFYRFVYKKPGIRLLTVYLFLTPLLLFGLGVYITTLHFPINLIMSLLLPIYLFFYPLNWQLRKINKKLKLNPAHYPQEYLALINMLNVSEHCDLEQRYNLLIQQWPQFEHYTTHTYKLISKK